MIFEVGLGELAIIGGIGIVVGIAVGALPFWYILSSYVPEWTKFWKARSGNVPCLCVTGMSGDTEFYIGTKSKPGEITFNTEHFSMKMDPMKTGRAQPERWAKGMRVLHYFSMFPYPETVLSAKGLDTLYRTIRETIPSLAFLSRTDLISLLQTKRGDLFAYCETMAGKYKQEYNEDGVKVPPMATQDLYNEIIRAQDLAAETPIETGFFSYEEGFKNAPSAYTSADASALVTVTEELALKNRKDGDNKIMVYAIAAMMVLVGGGLGGYMLSMSVGA